MTWKDTRDACLGDWVFVVEHAARDDHSMSSCLFFVSFRANTAAFFYATHVYNMLTFSTHFVINCETNIFKRLPQSLCVSSCFQFYNLVCIRTIL